jgi:hypothetical protein
MIATFSHKQWTGWFCWSLFTLHKSSTNPEEILLSAIHEYGVYDERTIGAGIDWYFLTSKIDADDAGMSKGKVDQGLINLVMAVRNSILC